MPLRVVKINLAYKGDKKMVRTNLSLFDNLNQLNHYAVGFDRVFDRLNDYAISQQSTSNVFPPYNIRKDGDFNFEIELALAGLAKKI